MSVAPDFTVIFVFCEIVADARISSVPSSMEMAPAVYFPPRTTRPEPVLRNPCVKQGLHAKLIQQPV